MSAGDGGAAAAHGGPGGAGGSATALAGVSVVDLTINVPGPVATSRLAQLGARVVKVEPPGGDLLAEFAPAWYERLCRGKRVLELDLKGPGGRRRLDGLLDEADLLVTTTRPSALRRLGLGEERLRRRHPRLCHVAIVGYRAPRQERAGHDLTYQAEWGLLDPPRMPRTLLVDLFGAERVVSECLAALRVRERGGEAPHVRVPLESIARLLADPLRHGLTAGSGVLGGGTPQYDLYESADGWVALAALERRLWEAFVAAVDRDDLGELEGAELRAALTTLFRQRSSSAWEALAGEHDLPLAAVRQPF